MNIWLDAQLSPLMAAWISAEFQVSACIAAHEANPEQGRSWEEIREEIRSKLGDRKTER